MIDTHCHIYFPEFDADRNSVIERSLEVGVVALLMPCVDSTTFTAMMDTAEKYPHCCPMIGLHPTSVNANWSKELDLLLAKLAAVPAKTFVAVGETGIDAFWSNEFLNEQKEAFATMLEMSANYDMPVVIHCRDAFNETFEVLKNHKKSLRGVFHAFSGDMEMYRKIKTFGDFKVGIGGVVTFKNANLAKVVQEIPLNDILLETDAPFLTPVPFRGKRNESAYLTYIVQKIAEIKQVCTEEVIAATTYSAKYIFGI